MSPIPPRSRPRHFTALSAALLGASVLTTPAAAQRVLTPGPDAVTLPRGAFRVETGGELTLQRDRWNAGQLEGLGGALTGTPLDATRLTLLAPIEGLVRGLGVEDFRASLGPARLDVRQRIFASALGLEYGVTSRITLGVRATLVRTRPEALFRARPDSTATLGLNPLRLGSGVAAANATAVGRFSTAATQLEERRTTCTANPAAFPECALILAEAARVASIASTAASFASGLGSLYGTAAGAGRRYVPLIGSAAESLLVARADSLRAAFSRYGITGIPSSGALPAGAEIGLTGEELDRLVRDSTDGFGARPLSAGALTAIGDVHVSAKVLLIDRVPQRFERGARGLRQSVLIDYRVGTGTVDDPDALFDIGTGTGTAALTVRSLTDVVLGDRFWTTVALGATTGGAAVARSLRVPAPDGTDLVDAGRTLTVQVTPGRLLDATIAPRWQLGDYLMIGALWQWSRSDGDRHAVPEIGLPGGVDAERLDRWSAREAQRVGLSLTYSTLAARRRLTIAGTAWELSYTHLQSIASPQGLVPKAYEDRLLLRAYPRFRAR
ncbi:MAG: hypothetical protein P3A32_02315 [Gemmatimonadota bacterium]|nr:hypothetical protein [Gemmatimonadota bacterium]MDQ8176338.1 hypothetical protein [Gemmatimonadota bacterium]